MKIYTSEKYGFSINYPKDWTVEEDHNMGLGPTVVFMRPMKGKFRIDVYIMVEELPTTMTVEEYATAREDTLKEKLTSFYKDEGYSTIINGDPAVISVFTGTPPMNASESKQKAAFFMSNTTGYIISCTASPSTYDEENENYFEPMIKSFELTQKGADIPGFDAVFAIVGLLAVAYLLRRR